MSCYNGLAPWYDKLTGDVPYGSFADFYEEEFRADGGEFSMLLDLCCGTGTLTWELARRGYEMIAVDQSPDMLMEAQSKAVSRRGYRYRSCRYSGSPRPGSAAPLL